MSTLVTGFIGGIGVIAVGDIGSLLESVPATKPADCTDIFLYTHGWWTDAAETRVLCEKFFSGFATSLLRLKAAAPPLLTLPQSSFAAGIHWPSMLSENPKSIMRYLEVISFYLMEHRADAFGHQEMSRLLKFLLKTQEASGGPLRIHLLGHSLGCRVICSALQQICADQTVIPSSVRLNVVLLQAAFDNSDLEHGQSYGDICKLNLRLLATHSHKDTVLYDLYPYAERIARSPTSKIALGAAGPTAAAAVQFGGGETIVVDAHFLHSDMLQFKQRRLIDADLAPLHAANPDRAHPIIGHHLDIYYDQVYALIAGFLFA